MNTRQILPVCLALLSFIVSTFPLFAQSPTQTIRGRVVDVDAKMGLPGVTVFILNSEPPQGTATDAQGNFRLNNVPVGRVSLKFSSVGYEDKIIPNLLVNAGKETVLEVEIRESFLQMDEIVVRADQDKSQVANDMALISARGFTVEETKRYAGAINDPARMVAAYAGVNSDASGNNDIIVRGNSPRSIQWRLEDVEIPNPNHFSQEGLTGGPINALNSQMLANSAFFTGAFAPAYGNALSGVFDMKLRKGNNEKREYSLSAGVIGTDLTAEGPFRKGGGASYLVNYRYSTLGLLDRLGVVDFNGIPDYQDMSFKLHLPTKNAGTFSVFGLGGKSNIRQKWYDESDSERLIERTQLSNTLGITGVTQYWPLSSKTFLQNTVALSHKGSSYQEERAMETGQFNEWLYSDLGNNTLRVASTVNHKLNSRNQLQAGVIYSLFNYRFTSRNFDLPTNRVQIGQNRSGNAALYQGFVSWKLRATENISLVSGIHSQASSLNNQVTLEPRTALRWDFSPRQAFTAGFGVHSRMESLPNYFAVVTDETGAATSPNTRLGFNMARHYVVGYENKLAENLFLKLEAYYQDLYNVAVENDPASSYSLLNQEEVFTNRALVNRGRGENLGLELTLERYFAGGYYFLLTGSVFDSKYQALDGVWRNTRFNGNYLGNFLIGKEFTLRSTEHRSRVLGVNARTALLGARCVTPIDEEASMLAGQTVRDESRAFDHRGDDVFTLNLSVFYRIDRKKTSQEFKLDVQNATGNAAVIDSYYNGARGRIEHLKQLGTFPVASYTLNF